LSKLIN